LTLTVWATNDRCLDLVEPKPIRQVSPEYPKSLRLTNNRGEVLIQFTVDKDGSVRNPTVRQSTHPALEAPAIAALLQWKFTPALLSGKPIARDEIVPIIFGMEDTIQSRTAFSTFPLYPDGLETYRVSGKTGKDMPPQYRYDTAPQPKLTVLPVYPFEMLKRSVHGSADVIMLVSADGTVEATKVKTASSPEFAQAAESAAFCWRFEPALLAGKPTQTLISRTFDFDDTSRDFTLDEEGEQLLQQVKEDPGAILRLKDLDRIPAATYRVRPEYLPGSPSGQVIVELYLDKTGMVRFPHAISSSNEILVGPSLTAVARWHFEPPIKGGKPVDAVAQIPIRYVAPKPAQAPAQ
jgi:TonB family protein